MESCASGSTPSLRAVLLLLVHVPRRIRELAMATPLEAMQGQGPPRDPRGPSAGPQAPAPGANGPSAKVENSRPVQYPVRLRVNINMAMAASLQRVPPLGNPRRHRRAHRDYAISLPPRSSISRRWQCLSRSRLL